MERYQASGFFGVPTLFEYLKEYEKTDRVNWKRLKMIVCGADTLHDSTVEAWEKRTNTKIFEGYGMTETTSVSHGSPFNRPKKGSFGVPIPNMKAAIIEHEGTNFMPVGEVGELILSGPEYYEGLLETTGEQPKRPFWKSTARPGCAPEIWSAWTKKAIFTSSTANGT